MSLTAERLRELLHYNPETGIFTRLVRTARRVRVGDIAGSLNRGGYWQIAVDGRSYLAHRLAWFYMTGKWPTGDLDHHNLCGSDNSWTNLRQATDSQNNANRRLRSTNTSGLKGVSWSKARSKWHARIKINGKDRHLGFSDCRAAAHFAYVIAADEAFGEFARAA
jgi:hypothetical protein